MIVKIEYLFDVGKKIYSTFGFILDWLNVLHSFIRENKYSYTGWKLIKN